MKDDHIVPEIGRVGKPDRRACFGIVGISARRQDGGDRGPLDGEHLLARHRVPAPLRNRGEMLAESRQQRGEQHLRLRIAEARVEFEHRRRAVGQHHQARVEHPLVRSALARDFAQHRLEYFRAHASEQRFRRNADGAVGAHPTGVRSRVVFAQPFVILGGRQDDDALTIRQRQHGQLFALEKVLDHELLAGVAERAGEHRAGDGGRVRARLADDGALAGGEARGLHDERLGVAADVVERRRELDEARARRGGDACPAHHFFRVCLGRLELRCGGRRAEHRALLFTQAVRQAGGERRLRTDDGDVDVVPQDGPDEVIDGGGGNGEIGAERGGARIARRGKQRQIVGKGRGGVATQCPAEGMFAAAASDDQYFHLFLNASENAWAARLAESTTSFTTAFASFI